MFRILLSLWLGIFCNQTIAGEVDVIGVDAKPDSQGNWSFRVTLKHADSGWKHYADRWEILSPNGEILATRVLAHPHVNEQPFTRSLSGIVLPDRLESVIIRAHDKIHGYGGRQITLPLNP